MRNVTLGCLFWAAAGAQAQLKLPDGLGVSKQLQEELNQLSWGARGGGHLCLVCFQTQPFLAST